MNYLLDKDFLKELDNYRNKEIYARVTALTLDELPIETIEGKITGGTINIDGTSAIRRTCSISLISKAININNLCWTLYNKFKLEIGVKNNIKTIINNEGVLWGEKYQDDICWFPQGIFIITNFNSTISVNSYTISINGQDKGCLLNGSVGGSLPSTVDFGVEEYYDTEYNMTIKNKIPIKTIIKEMIHFYGGEPYHNIVVNDLDEKGLELLEYRGSEDLYLLYSDMHDAYIQMAFDGMVKCYFVNDKGEVDKNAKELSSINSYHDRIDNATINSSVQKIKLNLDPASLTYTVAKIQYGDTAGYRVTPLVYPGDLISGIGESITSILDKIVQMLGNFEYFYDLDGRFIFQKKRTYLTTTYDSIFKNEDDEDILIKNSVDIDENAYYFNGNNLIKTFSNQPALNNIKNNFSIWGTRKSIATGSEIPINFQYAIHTKPVKYKPIRNIKKTDDDFNIYDSKGLLTTNDELNYKFDKDIEAGEDKGVDWRELIYQMALDHLALGEEDDFAVKLLENNKWCLNGITGYEYFYVDLLYSWRKLYKIEKIDDKFAFVWNSDIKEAPEKLDYWLDFLDVNNIEDPNLNKALLSQYSIDAIGSRSKVINDKQIKSIFYRDVPTVIFTTYKDYNLSDFQDQTGYTFMFLTNDVNIDSPVKTLDYFSISSQGKSAKEVLDELLYQHSYFAEKINISAIPVYYLEPNTKISVVDNTTNTNGEYIIQQITLPLTYNGTMSISASKVPSRIY